MKIKKSHIFTLVTFGLIAVILIAVLVVGLKSNLGEIFNAVSISDSDMQKYTNEVIEYPEDLKGFDINWISGKVTLEVIDGINAVHVTENSSKDLDEKEQMKVFVDGSLLRVDWSSEVFSFDMFNKINKNLLIQIPATFASKMGILDIAVSSADIVGENFSAQKMNIQSTSGRIDLKDFIGETVNMGSVSGNIELDKVQAQELHVSTTSGNTHMSDILAGLGEFNAVSGEVESRGKYDELKVSTVSGKVKIDDDKSPDKAEIQTVSGTINLAIPKDSGFELEFDTLSGSLDLPDGAQKKGDNRYLQGNGKANIKFGTTSGNARLEFID